MTHQPSKGIDGVGIGKAVEVVDREYAGGVVMFDSVEHCAQVFAGRVPCLHVERIGNVNTGTSHGKCEIDLDGFAFIASLNAQPGDGAAFGLQSSAALGEQGGLAEAAGRVEHHDAVTRGAMRSISSGRGMWSGAGPGTVIRWRSDHANRESDIATS